MGRGELMTGFDLEHSIKKENFRYCIYKTMSYIGKKEKYKYRTIHPPFMEIYMKSLIRSLTALLFVGLLVGNTATAQDIQQQLSKLGHDAAVSYISPILNGWGNDLNSGIYYSADLHDVLGFDVGVKMASSQFTDGDKTYLLDLPTTMKIDASTFGSYPAGYTVTLSSIGANPNYTSSTTANTAVGAKDETNITTLGGTGVVKNASGATVGTIPIPAGRTILTLPGGFDPGKIGVPLAMPQLNLGLPFGIELMARYIPTIKAGDYGKFNYMGFGVRYDIDQWIPLCPVDIAVHFMTQKLNFKSTNDADIFSGKATAYGVEVSKRFFILTLFGGFQLENSTLTLNDFTGYDAALGQSVTIPGFEVKGADKSRFTVGARLLLLFVNVHAEYSFATNPVLAAGVGITIR
jgi:hypothetical protein